MSKNKYDSIQYLDIESNIFGDDGMTYFNDVFKENIFLNLKRINLSNNKLTSKSIDVFSTSISNGNCPELESLILDSINFNLIGNDLYEDGIQYLSDAIQSHKLKKLIELSLNNTHIDMNAFIILSNSLCKNSCPLLKILNLNSIIKIYL